MIPMGNKGPQNDRFYEKKNARTRHVGGKGRLAMGIGLGGCQKKVPKNEGLVEKRVYF